MSFSQLAAEELVCWPFIPLSSLICVHTVCYRYLLNDPADNTQQTTFSHNLQPKGLKNVGHLFQELLKMPSTRPEKSFMPT